MLVSVGRIRLKPDASFWRFFWHSLCVYLQARRAAGIVRASVRRQDARTYFSMSVWKTREAMLAYSTTGSHLQAMKISKELATRIDFRHWQADAVPSWETALHRFAEQGE
jgi:hypothetical protein